MRLGWLIAWVSASTGCVQYATREKLMDPQICQECHAEEYGQWAGSMHAYAATDPVFVAMNRKGQRETNGALGSFCVNCHAPLAVREKATTDGLNLDAVPAELKGVTCFFCHTVEGVDGAHNNPLRLSTDLQLRGAFADPIGNSTHASTYSELHDRDQLASATLCGACHDVQTGHGADIERTFTEWQGSVFSKPHGGLTCSQCHLPQSREPHAIASVPGAPARREHDHTMRGVDVAITDFPNAASEREEIQKLLDTTLQTGLCVTLGQPRISVLLDNVGAGHGFPSGSAQDRRVWTEVIASVGGTELYRSGAPADAGTEALPGDGDAWLMRDCIYDEAGAQVHDFWRAASFESTTLPPQLTFDRADPRFYQSHQVKTFPQSGKLSADPDRVTLRVYARPISRDVTAELVASGDLAADVAGRIPTFQLGPTLVWQPDAGSIVALDPMGLPVSCVSATNLTIASSATPVMPRPRCRP